MSSNSALSLLRSAVQDGIQTRLDGDYLVIGASRFRRKAKTPYRSSKGHGSHYQLDAIWFWLQHEGSSWSQYVKLCRKEKIKSVKFTDSQEISNYMRGKTEECAYIDTSMLMAEPVGSSAGGRSSKRMKTAEGPPREVHEWKTVDVLDRERNLFTRDTILLARKPFTSIIKSFEKKRALPTAARAAHPVSRTDSRRKHGRPGRGGADSLVPIIIVPGAVSSVITMYNAQQLLGQGGFIPSENLRTEGHQKKSTLTIERASSRDAKRNVRFQVTDDIKSIKDWNRVVAVFATGKKWQLSDFPQRWGGDPAKIFTNVRGYHLYFSDEDIHHNITQWRVQRLPLSKGMRYNDRVMVMKFWQGLTEWMERSSSKRHLDF